MPNQPKTPVLGFRCPPELRAQLEWIAQDRKERLSDVVRYACERLAATYPAER